jgi:hypothetical protein
MPLHYEIIPALKLVRSRAWGVLSDSETMDHYERIAQDPAFHHSFSLLCDIRGVNHIEAAPQTLRDLARSSTFAPGTRRAFVVHGNEHFGIARMLQAFCELEGAEVGVFRSLADAYRMLQIQPSDVSEDLPDPLQ